MDEKDDPIITYAILGFIFVVIGYLVYKHTGENKSIEPVYWAGVFTPLLPMITKKVFKLVKKKSGT